MPGQVISINMTNHYVCHMYVVHVQDEIFIKGEINAYLFSYKSTAACKRKTKKLICKCQPLTSPNVFSFKTVEFPLLNFLFDDVVIATACRK